MPVQSCPSFIPPIERALVMMPTDDRHDGLLGYHTMHGDFREPKIRTIEITRDPAHTDTLVTADRPLSRVPGMGSVTTPLMTIPVPGRELVDGGSEHYLLWHDRKALQYRTIRTSHKAPYTITVVTSDRPVSGNWASMDKVAWPVAGMPVPGRRAVDGRSERYIMYYDGKSRLMYSTISISHDAAHADTLVTEDRAVSEWWPTSMAHLGQLAEICPVPGEQNINGKSAFYVFHWDLKTKRLMYRKISVGTDAAHTDTLESADRLVADWWTGSLKGVE